MFLFSNFHPAEKFRWPKAARRLIAALAAGAIAVSPLRAGRQGPEVFGIDAELHDTILTALNLLYDLRYDEALAAYERIDHRAAEHPMVAFGVASAHWWRLSVNVLEPDMEESAAFLKAAERCVELSERKIASGDPKGEAHLTLGGVLGLVGRWEATNQKYLSAYFKGKKAYKHLTRALEINPDMTDAYMGLGIFDYYVATLPAVVRVLAFLGMGGDTRKGLQELHIAADRSVYAEVPSKLFLTDLYANQEKSPAVALTILDGLRASHPRSPFIHMLKVISLYNFGDAESLASEAFQMMAAFQDGTYVPWAKTEGLFAMAIARFKTREWEEAILWFDRAIAFGHNEDAFYTWSFLYKGYALDALGRRDDAERHYRAVLDQLRRWGSHDLAKDRLKAPFDPDTAVEMKTLKL